MSRVRAELTRLQEELVKATKDGSKERMKDIIVALREIPVTLALLKEIRVSKNLLTIKEQYESDEVGTEAKSLLNKWREDCKKQSTAPSVPKTASPSSEKKTEEPKISTATSSIDWTNDDDEDNYDALPPNRRKIFDLFTDTFKLSVPEEAAQYVAFRVEKALETACDARQKVAKAKTLIFNLKSNERLRLAVVSGDVSAEELISRSPKDLASADLRGERAESTKAANMARRGDIYDLARNEIQEANGIGGGGEFVCRRCKGNKTTHYSLQTRSSDEPMTVFVNCLTCGARWRC